MDFCRFIILIPRYMHLYHIKAHFVFDFIGLHKLNGGYDQLSPFRICNIIPPAFRERRFLWF